MLSVIGCLLLVIIYHFFNKKRPRRLLAGGDRKFIFSFSFSQFSLLSFLLPFYLNHLRLKIAQTEIYFNPETSCRPRNLFLNFTHVKNFKIVTYVPLLIF